MNRDKLESQLKLKGIKVKEFIKKLEDYGLTISKSTYYKRMKGECEFDTKEIKAIVHVLGLSAEEMNDIFFEEIVSKKTLQKVVTIRNSNTINALLLHDKHLLKHIEDKQELAHCIKSLEKEKTKIKVEQNKVVSIKDLGVISSE